MNDAPTGAATIESKPCPEGGEVTFSRAELTAGVSDVDGGALSVLTVDTPTANGGAVVIVGDGVKYTARAGFFGTDVFTFTLSDGNGGNLPRTATVTVGEWAWMCALVRKLACGALLRRVLPERALGRPAQLLRSGA